MGFVTGDGSVSQKSAIFMTQNRPLSQTKLFPVAIETGDGFAS